MLEYFFSQSSLEEILAIKELLNTKKKKIERLNFTEPFMEYEQSKELFEIIKEKAIENGDEKFANAQFVAKCYFRLFCNLASYFDLLNNKKYKKSWDKLQDCFNEIYVVGKFVDFEKRFELNALNKLLKEYEKLYPYKIFASSEYVITKSECSICKKPMNSFECPHIKGNLYWGEIACENILEIKTINAVALVTNPRDKRCIIEIADEKQEETDKFKIFDEFLKVHIYPFQLFSIENSVILRRDYNIKKIRANEICPCGSGKKFKHCCRHKMFYEHYSFKIHLKDKIQFYMF